MLKPFTFVLLAISVMLPLTARAVSLSVTDPGVRVDAGSVGTFMLAYPVLLTDAGNEAHKIIARTVEGKAAMLRYEGGASATVDVSSGDMAITFKNVPNEITKFKIEMLIDFSYADGGKWKIGDNALMAFPAAKPAKPFLFQGSASGFQLTNLEGKSLSISYESSYQQLQDNREWNWKTFDWFMMAMLHRDWPQHVLKIAEGAPQAGVEKVVVVDEFGQDARMDFPQKVKSVAELKADIASEQQEYAGLKHPALDLYGGLPGSQATYGLRQTGFFHVEKKGARWILVDPAGNAFFHLGICSFQPGDDYTWVQGRRDLYAWLPSYEGEFHTAFMPDPYWSRDTISFYIANVIRKYGKPYDREEWLQRTIPRVRQWGFNSGGAFSGGSEAHQALHFPYVAHLPGGSDRQVPGLGGLLDPFDPGTEGDLEAAFAREVAPAANNPLVIGYYLGNEQPFEDIPKRIAELTGKVAAKRRLVTMLQQKYATIDAFNTAWGMDAKSFQELNDAGLPLKTAAAAADMAQFTELFLDGYYSMINRAFRKSDPNHMLLGSRWQPGTANNEALCRIAGKYMDIISVNYYTHALDKDFLGRLDKWTGDKPMFLSEWHYTSPSDSGLPGGLEVRSQKERGLAYRNYVEGAASLGYVVGSEWFTLIDQARTGRFFQRYNGENGNTGLLSVADRPWKDFVDNAAITNDNIYRVEFGQQAPYVYNDPRFTLTGTVRNTIKIARAVGAIKLDGSREGWPGDPPYRITGKRMVIGSDAGGVEASFRLCWDDTNLYLMAIVTDPTPMKNDQKGGDVWNGDGVELFIGHENPDQPGPMLFTDRQVLMSAGKPGGAYQYFYAHAPNQFPLPMVVVPSVDGKGYTLEAAIPFTALDFKPQVGQQLPFDLAIDDGSTGQSRQRQLMWNGVERNSSDRSAWGRAILTP